MKITLEGEPSEIEAFFKQRLNSSTAITAAMASEPVAAAPEVKAPEAPEAKAPDEEEVEVEAEVAVAEEEAKVETPAKKRGSAPRPRNYPPLRDQIVSFLETRKRSNLSDISRGMRLRSAQISPRLAELQAAGVVRKLTNLKAGNYFGLVSQAKESEPKKVVIDRSEGGVKLTPPTKVETLKSDNDTVMRDFLLILNALVDNPNSSLDNLASITNLSAEAIEDRCMSLEDKNLVQITADGDKMIVSTIAPTRVSQLPQPPGLLTTRIMEMVEKYPGECAEQIAIRLGKSYSDVARRLIDLKKDRLRYEVLSERNGDTKQNWRWYVRETETETV